MYTKNVFLEKLLLYKEKKSIENTVSNHNFDLGHCNRMVQSKQITLYFKAIEIKCLQK